MMVPVFYFILLFLFFGVQIYLWWSSGELKDYSPEVNTSNNEQGAGDVPTVTVLVPAQNEEQSIGRCLDSLKRQNYISTHLQIIMINDHSTDQTATIARSYSGVQVIDQKEGFLGKKAAIEYGVKVATGQVVLTMDADCEAGEDWVNSMIRAVSEDHHVLATGPVWMVPDKSGFLQKYQEMEQAALNVLTCGGINSGVVLSASGANMAYFRSLFYELDPYADNQNVPSGDDVFFAHQVYLSGGEVRFVLEQAAMVYTSPVVSYTAFIRQRMRWAGKSSGYSHWPTKLYLVGFGIVNLSFVFLLIAGVWKPIFYSYLFYGLLIKFIVDYLIIYTGMRWGNRPVCWQDVLKASLFQVGYVVYVTILLVQGKKGGWKND